MDTGRISEDIHRRISGVKRKRADHLNARDRKLAYAVSNREKARRIRGCTDKKQYRTRAAAEGHIERNPEIKRGHYPMVAYECRHCRQWHVGHDHRAVR